MTPSERGRAIAALARTAITKTIPADASVKDFYEMVSEEFKAKRK